MRSLQVTLYNAFVILFFSQCASAGFNNAQSGSGFPGSGGAGDPLTYDSEDCTSYTQFSNTVRNSSGLVLLDDDDYASWKGAGSDSSKLDFPSANAETDQLSKKTNHLMDVYDAYYNGSVTITLSPDISNSTTRHCANFTSQPITDAFLRIGPRSRDGVDRGSYDNNDFYLSVGRSIKKNECPSTPNKVFFGLESSSSLTYDGTAWDLNVTKANNAFSIKGLVPGRRAHYNNYYNYQVNTTDKGFVGSANDGDVGCPNWFFAQAITSLYAPMLRGSVDASEARVTWSFTDYFYGYKVTAVFSGKAWDGGAKLDMAKDSIVTTGEAKRVSSGSKKQDNLKYIIIAVVLVVVLIMAIGVFVLLRWSKKRQEAKMSEKKTQEEVWQQYQMSRQDNGQ